MQNIRVYTTRSCAYCVMAKRLLSSLDLPFSEIDVSDDYQERSRLMEITRQRTVPQIFIGDTSIGGYTELAALNRSGELAKIVTSK